MFSAATVVAEWGLGYILECSPKATCTIEHLLLTISFSNEIYFPIYAKLYYKLHIKRNPAYRYAKTAKPQPATNPPHP